MREWRRCNGQPIRHTQLSLPLSPLLLLLPIIRRSSRFPHIRIIILCMVTRGIPPCIARGRTGGRGCTAASTMAAGITAMGADHADMRTGPIVSMEASRFAGPGLRQFILTPPEGTLARWERPVTSARRRRMSASPTHRCMRAGGVVADSGRPGGPTRI